MLELFLVYYTGLLVESGPKMNVWIRSKIKQLDMALITNHLVYGIEHFELY